MITINKQGKINIPIGEDINYQGICIRPVEHDKVFDCTECCLCTVRECTNLSCDNQHRMDGKNVVFKDVGNDYGCKKYNEL